MRNTNERRDPLVNVLQEETQMRKTKFTRLISLSLAMLILVSSAVISVAAGGYDNTTDKSIYDYVDELNTISYEEYMTRYANLFVGEGKPATVTIEFDATKDWTFRDRSGNVITIANGNWTLTTKAGDKTYTSIEDAERFPPRRIPSASRM